MTEAEMRPLADIAFRIAKASLEKQETVSAVIVLHSPDGRTREYRIPESCEGLIMNSFLAKEVVYRYVRMEAESMGCDAVIFANETWAGKFTKAGMGLPKEAQVRLTSERGYQTGTLLGFIERHEAITVLLQTKEHVLVINQYFRRRSGRIEYYGESQEQVIPQANFRGAMKMFGELEPIRPAAEHLLAEVLKDLGPSL